MRRDVVRARVVLAVLVVAAVVLIVVDAGDEPNPAVTGARSAAGTAFGPVSSGVSLLARPMASAVAAVADAPGAQDRIEELEQRNDELETELASVAQDQERAADLAGMLHLSGLAGYEVVPAQSVTRLGTGGYADTVTLDVGTSDGVDADMTVVNGDGLVGRVVRASRTTSTVLLFTDSASSVGARMEGSRRIGAVHGRSHPLEAKAPAILELMQPDAPVGKGDRVVTMGSHNDAPFVPGVPVGTVTEVRDTPGALSRTAEIRPFVDFGSLDIVGVVVGAPADDPRDAVLPPEPGAEDADAAEEDR